MAFFTLATSLFTSIAREWLVNLNVPTAKLFSNARINSIPSIFSSSPCRNLLNSNNVFFLKDIIDKCFFKL